MMTAIATPKKTMASVLANAPGSRFGVIVAYRLVDNEEVHELNFNNARMVAFQIREIFGDIRVAEMLVYADTENVDAVNEIIEGLASPRKLKRITRNRVTSGRARTFVFKN